MRRLGTLLIALAAIAWAFVLGGAAAADGDLTSLTNSDRMTYGQRALATASDLQSLAQRRAEEMAAQQRLSHTQDLGKKVDNWRKLGENVGRGRSLEEIERTYMDSAPHRENILSPDFTQIGVGIATGGGQIYTAVIFRLPANNPATTAPAPAPAPKPVPIIKAAPAKPAVATTTAPPPPPPAPEPPPAPPATEPPPAPVATAPAPVETAPPSTSPVPAIDDWMLFPPMDTPNEVAGGFISDLPGESAGVPTGAAVSGVASVLGAWALFGVVLRHRRVEASLTRWSRG